MGLEGFYKAPLEMDELLNPEPQEAFLGGS